jgi:hypothetical protein
MRIHTLGTLRVRILDSPSFLRRRARFRSTGMLASKSLRIWLRVSLRASNTSRPSTGATAKYQARDSRVEPSEYSKWRARSAPELRLYPSAMFAAIEPSAPYSCDPIGRVIRERSMIRASSQPISIAYNANRYAVTLQSTSARSASCARACQDSNDGIRSTGRRRCRHRHFVTIPVHFRRSRFSAFRVPHSFGP